VGCWPIWVREKAIETPFEWLKSKLHLICNCGHFWMENFGPRDIGAIPWWQFLFFETLGESFGLTFFMGCSVLKDGFSKKS
jgi:hypothetical protein